MSDIWVDGVVEIRRASSGYIAKCQGQEYIFLTIDDLAKWISTFLVPKK